jgi:hypothetical protein
MLWGSGLYFTKYCQSCSIQPVTTRRSSCGGRKALWLRLSRCVAACVLSLIVGIPREFRPGMLLMLALSFFGVNASCSAVRKQRARVSAALCLNSCVFPGGGLCFGTRVASPDRGHWADDLVARIGPLGTSCKIPVRGPTNAPGTDWFTARKARYDTPLPNTRFFDPALELRVPGDLSKGFRNASPRNGAVRIFRTASGHRKSQEQSRPINIVGQFKPGSDQLALLKMHCRVIP